MPRQAYIIMARVEWMKEKLHAGRPWNANTMAEAFAITTKTAYRTVASLRTLCPDWDIKFDARENSYYLDSTPDTQEEPPTQMTGDEFYAIRDRLSLTQAQLAACIGTEMVCDWETGKKPIPNDIARLMVAWDRARELGHWRGRRRKRIKTAASTDPNMAQKKHIPRNRERYKEYQRAYKRYRKTGDKQPLVDYRKKWSTKLLSEE